MSTTDITAHQADTDLVSNGRHAQAPPAEPAISIETITPETATTLLANNINNRHKKVMKIRQYAADMRGGNWRLNGESIKLSTTGRLLDGQNRLHACIESGTPFRTLVVRGLDDVADQMTMDTGAPRAYSDVLKMRGEVNCSTLASVVRGVTLWNMGARRFSDGGGYGKSASGVPNPNVVFAMGLSNATLDATLKASPGLRDVAREIKRIGYALAVPAQIGGALWVAFHDIDAGDAAYFFERLESDEGHREGGDPVLALRRVLLNNRNRTGGHARRSHIMAWIIKGWNAYRAGDYVKRIDYTPGGARAEKFPEPQ